MPEQSADETCGDESATLQSRLEDSTGGVNAPYAASPTVADPAALLAHLDVSGHFHRDSRMGRMYHAGMVSLREDVASDSLHVSVDGNRVMAHVDDVSPLAVDAEGPSRYSVPRAALHNLAGIAKDLISLLRGRQGDHLCVLDCEWVSGEADSSPEPGRLLDPKTSAWGLQLEARVAGSLDEARLRSALRMAVGRPLAHACLHVVECGDADALDAARSRLYSTGVAITTFPPLEVCLARHRGGDVLLLNVNHAAADGFGAARVLDRVARAYAAPDDPLDPLDFLASHTVPVRPARAATSLPVGVYRTVIARLGNMLAPPARLAADEPSDEPGAGFCLVALSAEQTAAVVDAKRGVTETSVLMAALHLAIARWNIDHATPGRRIAVLMPSNLRPTDRHDDIVANFSVTTRISTSRRHRDRPASTLSAIAKQAARNKRTRTGIALIAALDRAGLLVLWAKQSSTVLQPLTKNHGVDAAMLCNLGSLDEAPSFGADAGDTLELWFSAPTRSPMSLSIGTLTMDERLHLTFRYPRRLFGPDAARRFSDCFVASLRAVVDSVS